MARQKLILLSNRFRTCALPRRLLLAKFSDLTVSVADVDGRVAITAGLCYMPSMLCWMDVRRYSQSLACSANKAPCRCPSPPTFRPTASELKAKSLVAVRVNGLAINRELKIVYRKDKHLGRAAQTFIEMARK